MSRTIISLPDEDKMWLGRQAAAEKVSMAELVRRALREYRERRGGAQPSHLEDLLERTKGCWRAGDGLHYQNAIRDEWERHQ